jgi:diadenosine tetraphosphate (Ap4A) HIT family hydrolase
MISRDFLGNTWEYDCMGCAIARQGLAVPGGFVWQSGNFCVHQDPLIPLPGFLVIGSARHVRTIGELTSLEYAEFSGLVRDAQVAIKQAVRVDHLTLIQEEYSSHFHLWFFPWLPEVIRKHGEPSTTKIRDIMADYSREQLVHRIGGG